MSLQKKCLDHLHVFRRPPDLDLPDPVGPCPESQSAAGEPDLLPLDGEPATQLLRARHLAPNARHHARVEEVEDARGEGQLAELEPHAGAFEDFARGRAFDAFARAAALGGGAG